TTAATPSPSAPCWVDVDPYPFGGAGAAVDPTKCGNPGSPTCLTVTSLAFRAWNRGLAATTGSAAFGLWLYNGTRWFPDPTFTGQSTCKGNPVLWAGKLDYWWIGPGQQNWPSLCRFAGVDFLWQPLKLPAATLARVADPDHPKQLKPGGITTGTCVSWDSC